MHRDRLLQPRPLADAGGDGALVLDADTEVAGGFDSPIAIVCGSGAVVEGEDTSIGLLNGATVTLRGFKLSQPDPNNLADFSFINADQSSLTLQDMSISISSPSWNTINQFRGKSLTIHNSTFQGGMFHVSTTDVAIDRSTFLGNAQIFFTNDGHSILIENSLLASPPTGALDLEGTDKSILGNHIVLQNSTLSDGSIGCKSTDFVPVIFDANILYNSSLLAFEPNGPPGCEFDRNLIFPSLPLSGTGNFTADPLFVDSANHDYHLQPLSPARDADPNTFVDHDYDGVQRPQGPRNDLGAFEYVPPAAP
jgi:hypothetical protein